ncbi:CLUMA_CG005775, isoform A [Clunio marinus]|uniref:CLUMA_CG005775, isoform A n=1 Tax=Clunio marinus TaxID=568069 RepID=A0A1J1HW20_9DIPT|nr:CLUMA_CG005775, isoform A [Clunio marinus]
MSHFILEVLSLLFNDTQIMSNYWFTSQVQGNMIMALYNKLCEKENMYKNHLNHIDKHKIISQT